MNLYDKFFELPSEKWKYYSDLSSELKNNLLMSFNPAESRNFIEEYFAHGRKSRAFDVPFFNKYAEHGKHEHTVSLFLFGCYLSDMINNSAKIKVKNYIKSVDLIAVSDTKRNLLGEKAGISRGWSVGVVESV